MFLLKGDVGRQGKEEKMKGVLRLDANCRSLTG